MPRLRLRPLADLLSVPTAGRLFLAHTQSSLGNGAGYVALMVLVYAHTASPWLLTAVLAADFLPAMFLGPWLGSLVDRSSRRACCVAADALRAVAFAGLALVGASALLVLFALLAGVGTALFSPAVLSGLDGVFDEERMPKAMSLFGAIDEAGVLVGPGIAAAVLAVLSPQVVLGLNAASFVVSGLLMAGVALKPGSSDAADPASRALSGLRQLRRISVLVRLLGVSSLVIACSGMLNVTEVVFALEELDIGSSGLSLLIACSAAGLTLGALGGVRAGRQTAWLQRYLLGLALIGASLLTAGLLPHLAVAAPAFFLAGAGNGLAVTHERLLIGASVPETLRGRAFALKRSAVAASFSVAFLAAGTLCATFGAPGTLVIAGTGVLLAFGVGLALLPASVHRLAAPAAPVVAG